MTAAPTTEVIPFHLALLLTEFADRADARYVAHTPSPNCGAMAYRFMLAANAAGLDAKVQHIERWREQWGEYDGTHFQTVVYHDDQRWIVDWTARQYSPDAPCPMVTRADQPYALAPLPEPEAGWTHMDEYDDEQARMENVDGVHSSELPDPKGTP